MELGVHCALALKGVQDEAVAVWSLAVLRVVTTPRSRSLALELDSSIEGFLLSGSAGGARFARACSVASQPETQKSIETRNQSYAPLMPLGFRIENSRAKVRTSCTLKCGGSSS